MAMQAKDRGTLVGVFSDRPSAERCVEELRRAGFRDDQIGFIAQDAGRSGASTRAGMVDADHDFHDDGDVTAGEGMVTGAITGGLIGAAAALFIPAVGPVLAGGILASTLTGIIAGAATGGVAAALIDLGVSDDDARYYESEFKSGRLLVTVKPEGRWDEARSIMQSCGAHFEAGTARAAMSRESTTDTGKTVQLREEELRATKTPVETGEVQIHKEVVTEHRSIDVPVKREEVFVERHAVNRPADDADFTKGDETIRMPVMEEQVSVEKRAVVREEIEIGKREVTDTEHVTGEVRREEARIERTGDVDADDEDITAEERMRRLRERRSA